MNNLPMMLIDLDLINQMGPIRRPNRPMEGN